MHVITIKLVNVLGKDVADLNNNIVVSYPGFLQILKYCLYFCETSMEGVQMINDDILK